MTIVDIAKESGYSVSTVSRVLNNRRDVSPEAKERIMEIVHAHNFVPNNNAKHLKQTVTKNIIVLVKGTSNMLFASIIEEIQHTIENTLYTVSVYYLDEDDNEVNEAIRLSRERKPVGILFLGGNPSYFEEAFDEVEIPCVLVTNNGKDWGFDNLSSVATDDELGACAAVDYLFECGHKEIAIMGGDLKTSHTSKLRYHGCEKSFDAHGEKLDESHYVKCRFSFDSAYRAMKKLLERGQSVTAVFAMSDVMAIGAIRAIRDAGLSVPEDISIVGFDGTMLADYYNPKLTTIRQEHHVIATKSVEILFNVIDFNKSAVHETIPFELSQGESVKKLS